MVRPMGHCENNNFVFIFGMEFGFTRYNYIAYMITVLIIFCIFFVIIHTLLTLDTLQDLYLK